MNGVVRRIGVGGGLAGVLAVVLSGCVLLPGLRIPAGGPETTPEATAAAAETRTVYGYVLITDVEMTPEKYAEQAQRVWDTGDSSCVAPAGFDDIVAGGEVQVLGPGGVIATGTVEVGDFQSDVMSANAVIGCGFPIVIEDVPLGLERYGLHVGAESRPAFAFSASEMRSGPRLFLP